MSLTLLATPLVVIALVNLAKRLGMAGAGPLALLAVILGIGLALGDYLALGGQPATTAGVYTAIATGLILGLTAAGLYDVADKIGGTTYVADLDTAEYPAWDDEDETETSAALDSPQRAIED